MSKVSLEGINLVKKFDGVTVLDARGQSFRFEEGRITALIGPNGAGKTTLFNLIAGVLKPDQGEICYRNRRIDGLSAWRVARAGIGRLFQDVRIFSKLTVLENVLIAFQNQLGENPVLTLLRRPTMRKEELSGIEAARHHLSVVRLQDKESALADELSYGEQKLLAIVRLLATGADVLLLDELTAGVNEEMANRLLQHISELAHQGKTIIMIEHEMSFVRKIAHKVYFMDRGQVVKCGLPDEVLDDNEIRSIYLGL